MRRFHDLSRAVVFARKRAAASDDGNLSKSASIYAWSLEIALVSVRGDGRVWVDSRHPKFI